MCPLASAAPQERCGQKSRRCDRDRWRGLSRHPDSQRRAEFRSASRSHLRAGILHPNACRRIVWRRAAFQTARQCWEKPGRRYSKCPRQGRATSLRFASLGCAKARTKSSGSFLMPAVCLIGLSHRVTWEGEHVNFALGIFGSPTDHQSHEDCPLWVVIISSNVDPGVIASYPQTPSFWRFLRLLFFVSWHERKFTAKDSHRPIKIRLIAHFYSKSPPPPSVLDKVTPLSPYFAHSFIFLWSCTEAADSMRETLRAKETYCFYCQGCMTRLLEDRWEVDRTRKSIGPNGSLFPPSSSGRGASVYWWGDPAVESKKID